jgi:uncharacterized protein (UPF0332 family)
MSFDWSSFAVLAQELVEQRGTSRAAQACARTSISRSYYAVFGQARRLLEARGHSPGTTNVHEWVRRFYERSAEREERQVATHLSRLRDLRRKADYEDAPQPALTAQDATLASGLATQAIEKLSALAEG